MDDTNLVFACGELDFACALDGLEIIGCAERNLPGRNVVDRQVLDFVPGGCRQLVIGPKRVIACGGYSHLEFQVAFFHLDELSTRCICIFGNDDFVIIGKDGVFGF